MVGSLCVLAPDFATFGDASGGPLTLGQVGVVVQVSTARLQLRPQSGGDRVWWCVLHPPPHPIPICTFSMRVWCGILCWEWTCI